MHSFVVHNNQCFVDCNEPDEIQNGKVNLTKGRTTYGAIVVYICDDEYVILGSSSRKCDLTGNTAAWSPESPVCKLKGKQMQVQGV